MLHVSTRQRLLNETITVIEAEGVPGVKVLPIATAAGVTVPSVYHFFGSKEGMIEAAQAERYGRVLRDVGAQFGTIMDASTTIQEFDAAWRSVVLGFCDARGANRRLARINALGSGYAHPELLAAINEIQVKATDEFATVIALAQERGWVRAAIDPIVVAAWLMGSLLGRTLIEIGPNPVDPDQWNEAFLESAAALLYGSLNIPVD